MATPREDELVRFVRDYAQRGILLDTNILLVYVIGQYDPNQIEAFKRTNTFTTKDYLLLDKFLGQFRRIVVTPHVLTEVSNLAAHLDKRYRSDCFKSFARSIGAFAERSEAANVIAMTPAFKFLGLTDASLPLIARERFLVLTDDLALYAHLLKSGVDAINFNHIRLLGWTA